MGKHTSNKVLTVDQARRVYDRIGQFLDWQLYERCALRQAIRIGCFESAESIFEFGCGTGLFAAKLLRNHVSSGCQYVGLDVSAKMVALANSRLKPWAERATVKLSDGTPRLHEPDGKFDHFVSNYVFDLLDFDYATVVISEAHRVLRPKGKLILTSLAHGTTKFSKLVTLGWEMIWRHNPEWIGGCRPVDLRSLVRPTEWSIDHHTTVVSFGITSDVLVASRCSP